MRVSSFFVGFLVSLEFIFGKNKEAQGIFYFITEKNLSHCVIDKISDKYFSLYVKSNYLNI